MYKPVTTNNVTAYSQKALSAGGYTVEPSVLYGAGSSKRAKQLQLASAGFFVMGIFVMMVGVGMLGCGLVNIIVGKGNTSVTGFPPGIVKLLAGVFTVVNGVFVYMASQRAIIRLQQLKVMFPLTSVALLLHLVVLVLAVLGIFNAYLDFGEDMQTACNRDSNSFSKVVADAQYSGANLNPNYNPNCAANNPNCNINVDPILNYNYNYWYSQMQNIILSLYNNYKYVFRYAFAVDALHVLFSLQLMVAEICLLVVIGHMMSHIDDVKRITAETEPMRDPTLRGSQIAMPRSRGPAQAEADKTAPVGDEPIYVNVHAANVSRPNVVNGRQSNWSVYTSSQHAPGQVI